MAFVRLDEFVPSLSVFTLGGAALTFYIAARTGADALTRRRAHPRDAASGLVVAHWLPTAAVVAMMVRDQPEGAVSMIFASSVACLTLALGTVLLSAPAPLSPDALADAPHRRAWPMLLPAAVLALLAGFSARLTPKHALIFALQGVVALVLWSDDRDARAAAPHDVISSPTSAERSRGGAAPVVLEAILWIGLSLTGGWLANRAATDLIRDVPRLTVGIISAMMLAPAVTLPLIGTGLGLTRDGRPDSAVVSACVGCALMNLCALLPLTILAAHVVNAVRAGGVASLASAAWLNPGPNDPSLPFPMAVWRIDTVLLIVLGAIMLLISSNHWLPRRGEALVLLIVYGAYMLWTSVVAGR